MKKLVLFTVAVMVAAMALSASASVVVATNTVTFFGIVDGTNDPAYQLNIKYDVTLNSGVYNYNYLLTTAPGEDLYAFTLGGAPDPIDTQTMAILSYGGASPSASGISSDSVGWIWGFNSGVTSADVSFTSDIAPGTATFTLNDDDIAWTSPPPIPAPVPEPSSWALLAASAFVYGFFRFRRTPKLKLQKISVRRESRAEAFSFEKRSLF